MFLLVHYGAMRDAQKFGPAIAASYGAEFTGQWSTIVEGCNERYRNKVYVLVQLCK